MNVFSLEVCDDAGRVRVTSPYAVANSAGATHTGESVTRCSQLTFLCRRAVAADSVNVTNAYLQLTVQQDRDVSDPPPVVLGIPVYRYHVIFDDNNPLSGGAQLTLWDPFVTSELFDRYIDHPDRFPHFTARLFDNQAPNVYHWADATVNLIDIPTNMGPATHCRRLGLRVTNPSPPTNEQSSPAANPIPGGHA